MRGSSAWATTPRGRRSTSELADAIGIESSGLVLMVGAGLDQALSDRPSWQELLAGLARRAVPAADADALGPVARDWPVETAEALRVSLGRTGWESALQNALPAWGVDGPADLAGTPADLAEALAVLVERGVRVVISLNYTDDLATALRHSLKGEWTVQTIDRSDLAAWTTRALLSPPAGHLHIVKLHGSVFGEPGLGSRGVVLDRSSYDAATSSDALYRSLLGRLFHDQSVLSIGLSWTDVVVRDAAASAREQLPIARPMHYALREHRDSVREDWWEERALTASFGVRPLYYDDHAEVTSILSSVEEVAQRTPPTPGDEVSVIADWLDMSGDHESPRQAMWFAEHLPVVESRLSRLADHPDLDVETWMACARIERHLRHFLWFWLDPTTRVDRRRHLWEGLALAHRRLPASDLPTTGSDLADWLDDASSSVDDRWRRRGLFEFALGCYEVFGSEPTPAAARWRRLLGAARRARPDAAWSARLDLATRIWRTRPAAQPDEVRVRGVMRGVAQARDAMWEGMEAKLLLDVAQIRLAGSVRDGRVRPRSLGGDVSQQLWAQGDHAREVSRLAGSYRREAGAVVLTSFLAPVDDAERDLLAVHRRLGAARVSSEPTATWSIVIGLLATYIDRRGSTSVGRSDPLDAGRACSWLVERWGGDISISPEIARAVRENYGRHWKGFHPEAAALSIAVAQKLLEKERARPTTGS